MKNLLRRRYGFSAGRIGLLRGCLRQAHAKDLDPDLVFLCLMAMKDPLEGRSERGCPHVQRSGYPNGDDH